MVLGRIVMTCVGIANSGFVFGARGHRIATSITKKDKNLCMELKPHHTYSWVGVRWQDAVEQGVGVVWL